MLSLANTELPQSEAISSPRSSNIFTTCKPHPGVAEAFGVTVRVKVKVIVGVVDGVAVFVFVQVSVGVVDKVGVLDAVTVAVVVSVRV